jgi:hypothetical protein
LYEQYYEGKAKEFYELKLGYLRMKFLCGKFFCLLRYVPYIVDEKPKIQRFLSFLASSCKYRIKFDNPKTLEETMRKGNLCFPQYKNINENYSNWSGKKVEKFDHKKKVGA